MNNTDFINDIEAHGYKLITIPNGIKDYFDFQDKEGYKYHSYYNAIYKTWNPKKWGKNNKYSLYNINVYLKNNNITDLECLEDREYNYKTIWFKCKCGNIFYTALNNFLNNERPNCPICGRKRSANKHIKKQYLDIIINNGLELYQEEYKGIKNKTYFKNKDGYIVCGTLYNAIKNKNFDGFSSSTFNIYNKYCNDNVNLWIKKNGGHTTIVKFINAKDICLKCQDCGHTFNTTLWYMINNKKIICNDCILKKRQERIANNFEYEKSIFKEYELKLLEPYKNSTSLILCQTKNGYLINESVQTLRTKNNIYSRIFHSCNPHIIYNINNYIKENKIKTQLITTKYICAKSKLTFKCECGQLFKQSLNNFLNGETLCHNCRNVVKSKLEKRTKQMLDFFSIKNIQQYTFADCKDKQLLPFDFYLPQYNICIECQGIQHFAPIEYFGGEDKLKYTQYHDEIKYNYCIANNIKIIYINYDDTQQKIYNLIKDIALRE